MSFMPFAAGGGPPYPPVPRIAWIGMGAVGIIWLVQWIRLKARQHDRKRTRRDPPSHPE
jgi:hypothetical protein